MAMHEFVELREAAGPWLELLECSRDGMKLCHAIAWSDRFSLHVALCTTPPMAAALQLWLLDAVPLAREHATTQDRVSPYPLDWRVAAPALVDPEWLVEQVRAAMLAAIPVDLLVVDAARAGPGEAEAWAKTFALLNSSWSELGHDAALLFVLPPPLVEKLALSTGDRWSSISGVVEFAHDDIASSETSEFVSGEALVRRLRALDAAAFELAVTRYASTVRTVARALGNRDVDDVMQRALDKLIRSDPPIHDLRLHFVRTAYEHAQSVGVVHDEAPPLTAGENTLPVLLVRLEAAWRELPAEMREIHALLAAGLSLAQMGELLGWSEATVIRRVVMARRRLDELIDLDDLRDPA